MVNMRTEIISYRTIIIAIGSIDAALIASIFNIYSNSYAD